MRVNVPFDFNACGKALPVEVYKATLQPQEWRAVLSQVEGTAGCYLPVMAFKKAKGTPEYGALLLHQYGRFYFLIGVRTVHTGWGADLFTTGAERELVKAQAASTPITLIVSGN